MNYIETFQLINQTSKSIRLMNVYKGVPIAYEADVLEVKDEEILIQTDPKQIVCLYRERQTYIQSEQLPEILRARVTNIDLHSLQATLSEFSPSPGYLGDRNHVRVQPKDPIRGQITTKELIEPVEAELADISVDGLAVYIPHLNYQPRLYRIGGGISVLLRLPGTYEVIGRKTGVTPHPPNDPIARFNRESLRLYHLPSLTRPASNPLNDMMRRQMPYPEMDIQGIIVNSRPEAAFGRYRVGARILSDDQSRNIIGHFIMQRQSEIIRELQEISMLISSN